MYSIAVLRFYQLVNFSDDGTYVGVGTISGSVSIYIAFGLQVGSLTSYPHGWQSKSKTAFLIRWAFYEYNSSC